MNPCRLPTVALTSLSFLGRLSTELLVGIIVAIVLSGAGWLGRRWIKPRFAALVERTRLRWTAPTIWTSLLLSLDYTAHQRDVMQLFWRLQGKAPDRVRERIRQDVMEPIRDVLPRYPGEHLKVVWFRPTDDRKELMMYQQVGHTPEGQAQMRLPVGVGAAGRAFESAETVLVDSIAEDFRYHQLTGGMDEGSALCAPILRGPSVTGVLSVLSSRQNAFWITEQRYIEALAAAIGTLETLEKDSSAAEGKPQQG